MPIHERGYRHYAGRRRGRPWRALTIATSGVKLALKRKALIALVLLGVVPAFLLAMLVYQASRVGDFTVLAGGVMYSADEWTDLFGGHRPEPLEDEARSQTDQRKAGNDPEHVLVTGSAR